jgi:glutamyl-Q tRNA(Asp) synthetase
VVLRREGYIAYQLAVVVDDAAQGITDVVRGIDLLDSTPRQVFLQRLLGLPTPRYMHLPIVAGEDGEKLSKQTGAAPIDARDAAEISWQVLAHARAQAAATNARRGPAGAMDLGNFGLLAPAATRGNPQHTAPPL